MGRVNFIGSNPKNYWVLIWQVDDHILVLTRAMMGGLFWKIIDSKGDIVASWPSTYNKQIIAMQANYLIDQILKGNAAWVRKIEAKMGFVVKLPMGIEENSPEGLKETAKQMTDWVNKVFGGCLDEFEYNYPYVKIEEFVDADMIETVKLIDKQHLEDFIHEHQPKARKLKKVEEEETEESPEDMFKEATKHLDDPDEWSIDVED
jgi:hypothetical protein